MDAHREAHEDPERWRSLIPGQHVTVVKLRPDGAEATRYPGVVITNGLEDEWLAIHAAWTYKRLEIDGLVFEPGDQLLELFSPSQPFNAFAVLDPEGMLRGWYANVTYPTYLEHDVQDFSAVTLFWHDLYLDLVGLGDGSYVVLDEDELQESGLSDSSPRLHAEIVAAGEELVRRFTEHLMPFRMEKALPTDQAARRESQE